MNRTILLILSFTMYIIMKGSPKTVHFSRLVKGVAYLTTMLSYSTSFGLVAAYSMIKSHLSQEIDVGEGYLGMLDSLKFLGQVLCSTLLIVRPCRSPQHSYFLSCWVKSLLIALITLISALIPSRVAQVLLLMVTFIWGYARGYVIIPYMVISRYFDAANKDKTLINIWFMSISFGASLSIFLMYLLMRLYSWKVSFLIYLAFFFSSAIAMKLTTIEINVENEGDSEQVGVVETLWEIKEFLNKPQNMLWFVNNGLIFSIMLMQLLWFPYYFASLGLPPESALAAVVITLFHPISSWIFGSLVSKYHLSETNTACVLLTLSTLLQFSVIFITPSQQSIWTYSITLTLVSLFLGWPIGFISSTEYERWTTTNREKYLIFGASRGFNSLCSFAFFSITGFLMEIHTSYFLYSLSLLCLSATLLSMYRFRKYSFAGQEKEPEPSKPIYLEASSEFSQTPSQMVSQDCGISTE